MSRCLHSNRGTNGGAMAPYQSKVCHLQDRPLELETQLRNFASTTDEWPLTLLQVRISNSLSTCWVKLVSWNGPRNVCLTVRFELAIKMIPRDAELQTSVIMSKTTVKINEQAQTHKRSALEFCGWALSLAVTEPNPEHLGQAWWWKWVHTWQPLPPSSPLWKFEVFTKY